MINNSNTSEIPLVLDDFIKDDVEKVRLTTKRTGINPVAVCVMVLSTACLIHYACKLCGLQRKLSAQPMLGARLSSTAAANLLLLGVTLLTAGILEANSPHRGPPIPPDHSAPWASSLRADCLMATGILSLLGVPVCYTHSVRWRRLLANGELSSGESGLVDLLSGQRTPPPSYPGTSSMTPMSSSPSICSEEDALPSYEEVLNQESQKLESPIPHRPDEGPSEHQ